MLKSETLKIMEFNAGEIKKPVLIRYSVKVEVKNPMPYDEDVLKLINSVKSLPDVYEKIEFYYEVADSRLTRLERQRIIIKINGILYYELILDDDLELFFCLLRLFKHYETSVESYEQLVTTGMLLNVIEANRI